MNKKISCLFIFVFCIFCLTACTKNEIINNTNTSDSEEMDDNVHIDMRLQRYNNDSDYCEEIFEIPIFISNMANSELEKLNIKVSTLLDYYTGDYEGYSDEDTWNIISYPISNSNYLQVITTAISYPNYGTDGEVYSFNYDINNKKMMTLSDVYNYDKKSKDEIISKIKTLYSKSKIYDGSSLKKIDINGFLIIDDSVRYFVTIYENSPGIGYTDSIYTYDSSQMTLEKYVAPCLINPDLVDNDFSNLYCKRESVRESYFSNLN